jgi:hypothetical protein
VHHNLISAGGADLGLARQSMGHREQPPRQRSAVVLPPGLPGQRQKRGLGDVVGLVGIRQPPPGDASDQRPVPADQLGERGLIAVGGEAC